MCIKGEGRDGYNYVHACVFVRVHVITCACKHACLVSFPVGISCTQIVCLPLQGPPGPPGPLGNPGTAGPSVSTTDTCFVVYRLMALR